MKHPAPGKAARGSRTGRPVMVLLDLMGRRMALRILWELSRAPEPMTFRALQSAAETNPALLNTRLKELRAAMLVTHQGQGYGLSDQGQKFVRLIVPVVGWAEGWAKAIDKSTDGLTRPTSARVRASPRARSATARPGRATRRLGVLR